MKSEMPIDFRLLRRALYATFLVAAPCGTAQAAFICIGASPRFVLMMDGAVAQFDFYPDQTFAVDPPAPERPDATGSSHTLRHDDTEIATLLRPAECPLLGATLPVQVELAQPGEDTVEILSGCCTLMAQ